MDADEREIFHFLKTWGSEFVGAKEICRRAGGKKKFYENPDWAKPLLMRMEERGIFESDSMGRYRIKPVGREKIKAQALGLAGHRQNPPGKRRAKWTRPATSPRTTITTQL